jgi:TPR repeat protein
MDSNSFYNKYKMLCNTEKHEEAIKSIQVAAEMGLANAQYDLGCCYHAGDGISKDMVKAVYWWTKAADQGNAEAQCSLGVCYDIGEGISKDSTKAVYW